MDPTRLRRCRARRPPWSADQLEDRAMLPIQACTGIKNIELQICWHYFLFNSSIQTASKACDVIHSLLLHCNFELFTKNKILAPKFLLFGQSLLLFVSNSHSLVTFLHYLSIRNVCCENILIFLSLWGSCCYIELLTIVTALHRQHTRNF